MPVGGQAYTPPTMSARTTSAPCARTPRAGRSRALCVEAMGGGGGAVGLRYEAMGGLSLSTGASIWIGLTSSSSAYLLHSGPGAVR